MPTIDLDAARAARREASSETPTVVFGGVEFALPEELPFGVFVHLGTMRDAKDDLEGAGAMRAVLGALFGDRADEFLDLGPSLADIEALVSAASDFYVPAEDGDGLGEPEASASS